MEQDFNWFFITFVLSFVLGCFVTYVVYGRISQILILKYKIMGVFSEVNSILIREPADGTVSLFDADALFYSDFFYCVFFFMPYSFLFKKSLARVEEAALVLAKKNREKMLDLE